MSDLRGIFLEDRDVWTADRCTCRYCAELPHLMTRCTAPCLRSPAGRPLSAEREGVAEPYTTPPNNSKTSKGEIKCQIKKIATHPGSRS
jgi:hypothetical protein